MTALILKPTAEEWKAKRVNQIGASEIATIVGCSKYGNIVDLWNEKVTKQRNDKNSTAMEWGHFFEPGVAAMFEERTGLEVIKASTGDWQFVREGAEWMTCSPDRTYWLNKENHNARDWQQKGLLECKTTVVDPEAEGNEWMLQSWYCQVQWQLLVAEMKEAYLCCAVFGFERKEVIKHWPANPEFQAKLLQIVSNFWNVNVLQNIAPTPRTKDEMLALFPKHTEGKVVEASAETNSDYLRLKVLNDSIKQMTAEADELKERIILSMEDAEKMEYMGQLLCTYKAAKDSQKFDSAAFKAENPELYTKYCSTVPGSRRFALK